MKNKNDKRLLGAFDYIDDKYIESAAKKIKPRTNNINKRGANKIKMVKQIAILAACLILLGAAVPLAGRLVEFIPELFNPAGMGTESNNLEETNQNEAENLPEEYFSRGIGTLSYPSYVLGVEYNGCWIHSSAAYENISSLKMEFFEYIYKYDPVAKVSSSICIDSACKHIDEGCPAFIPVGWTVRSITVFDDWCMYMFIKGVDLDSNNAVNDAKVRLYNMKTGESRDIDDGISDSRPITALYMDGKVYLSMHCVVWDGTNTFGTGRDYIVCYDIATGEIREMFDIPANMYLVGMTNKRFFLANEPYGTEYHTIEISSIDYSGENYKKEDKLDFCPTFVCGTYAYGNVGNYTLRVYDLATDSVSDINFGNTQYVFVDNGELGFTTTSRIDEYVEYRADADAYIVKLYSNVKDENTLKELKRDTEIIINCKVDMQLYLTDAKGENKTLVFEGKNICFNPYRRVGDYIIGTVRKASKYETKILDSGFAALNLKTGEIEMIPAVNFE